MMTITRDKRVSKGASAKIERPSETAGRASKVVGRAAVAPEAQRQLGGPQKRLKEPQEGERGGESKRIILQSEKGGMEKEEIIILSYSKCAHALTG